MIIPQRLLKRLIAAKNRREFSFICLAYASVALALACLVVFIYDVVSDGIGRLDWGFLTSFPSRKPEAAGVLSAVTGSIFLAALVAVIAFPLGVLSAVYLEEYAAESWFARLIELNIANLAAVPSIIYGILGLEVFVRVFALGRSLIAGALTMALLVLPMIIITSREALRAVPVSIREASYALGATRWQTVWRQVIPLAFPSILTGVILALSRAVGETAPLITMGALTYVAFVPDCLMSPFTVLPIQIFNWVSRPQTAFHTNAAAGIVVLLAVLLAMNSLAIWLRNRWQTRL